MNKLETEYFRSLCLSRDNAGVRVENLGPKFGRVVFTTRKFAKGELLWTEEPFISLQDTASKQNPAVARACGHCCSFLGSHDEQAQYYRALLEECDFPEFSSSVPCEGQCGELYCSKTCQQRAKEQYHDLLCVGPLYMEHPLVQFKHLAVEAGDLPLLAARGICRVIMEAHRKEISLEEALLPLKMLHHSDWKKMVLARNDGSDPNVIEDSLKMLFELFQKGLQLLGNEHFPELHALIEEAIVDFSLFEEFLNCLDCNTQAVGICPPFSNLWELIDDDDNDDDAVEANDKPVSDDNDKPLSDNDSNVSPQLLKQVQDIGNALICEMENEDIASDESDADEESEELLLASSSSSQSVQQALNNQLKSIDKKDRMKAIKAIRDKDSSFLIKQSNDEKHSDCSSCSDDADDDDDDDALDSDVIDMYPESSPFARLEGVGVFQLIAAINHSCSPNTVVTYTDNNKARVIARRPLEAGEQIFHSYVQQYKSRERRQQSLDVYGFVCECTMCIDSTTAK